jgi:DNA replication protein DnaC
MARSARPSFALGSRATIARVTAPGEAPEVCRECGGTGWVPSAGDPTRVTRCGCRRQRDAQRLFRDADLPPRYRSCTLQGFSTVHDEPACRNQLVRAVVLCRRYVDEFLSDRSDLRFRDTGLLFTGPPGAGKTHLAVATLRELIATYRVRGRFVDFTSLVQDLQSAIDPDAPFSRNQLLEPIENAEVLVVDELGAQTLSPWAADVLYDLINRRYARRLPTLFTTNYRLDDPAARLEALTADRAFAEYEAAGPGSGARGRYAQGASILSRRIPGMLVSRLWEMAQVVSLDAVKDYRMEVRSHQHRA